MKPNDSMAECHAKKARKEIAKKKAKPNEEKLEQLVDQLKGQIESTATAEVKSPKIIQFSIKIPFELSILYSF